MRTRQTAQGVAKRSQTALESRGAAGAGEHPQCGHKPEDGQGRKVAGIQTERRVLSHFAFFRSFRDTMEELPRPYQLPYVKMLCNYVFDGVEPDGGTPSILRAMFVHVRPELDKSVLRSMAGRTKSKRIKTNQTESNEIKRKREAEKETERKNQRKDKKKGKRKRELTLSLARESQERDEKADAISAVDHPSLDAILSWARANGIDEAEVREWHAKMERDGWQYLSKGKMIPVTCHDWMAACGGYIDAKKKSAARAVDDTTLKGGGYVDTDMMHYD